MAIWDDFDTSYTPSPATLFGIQSLLPQATHASLASDIGKALKGLQNEMSKANTNAYARELEMLHPEDVLAMEAQGLDPRTAKLGKGFIYDPENELIKEAFKNLKTKTSSALTGKVKRAKDRLSKEDIKKLRQKGNITEADLLALAGIDSAFVDDTAIQDQADVLNEAFNSQAQNEAIAYLKGLSIDDPRARALWNGDNSFFADNGYSARDAELFGDALRNSAEGRSLVTMRLNDLYKREQAENALNNAPLENAADWMAKRGFDNFNISLDALDPNSDAFAAVRDAVETEKNKVIAADAKARINESVRKEENVSPTDLQRYLTSATKEELANWVTTSTGTKAIGSLAKTFVNELEKENKGINWQTLVNPATPNMIRRQMQRTILDGIDKQLTKYNLQDIPTVREAVKQNLMLTINDQLMDNLGAADNNTKNNLRLAQSKLMSTLGDTSDSSLAGLVKDWIERGETGLSGFDINNQDLRDFSNDPRIRQNIRALFGRLTNYDAADTETEKELTNLLYSYMLPREVDTFGSNMTLLDYLKEHKGTRNLTTKGRSEILGGKREMVTPSALAEFILGGDIANNSNLANDPQFEQLRADQQAIIDLLDSALKVRKSKKEREKLEDVLKTFQQH